LISDLTLAIALKLSNKEDETLLKLLLGDRGDEVEKTELTEETDEEEGGESDEDRLGTDTLLGFDEIAEVEEGEEMFPVQEEEELVEHTPPTVAAAMAKVVVELI
jgi:hypothetical protein